VPNLVAVGLQQLNWRIKPAKLGPKVIIIHVVDMVAGFLVILKRVRINEVSAVISTCF